MRAQQLHNTLIQGVDHEYEYERPRLRKLKSQSSLDHGNKSYILEELANVHVL